MDIEQTEVVAEPEARTTLEIIQEQLELDFEETPVVEEEAPVVEEAPTVPHETSNEELMALREQYERVAPAEGFIKYIEEMNLSQEDVFRALELATLYNKDPRAALESLNPIHEQLAIQAGERFSPEIQALLDQGEITEQAANAYQSEVNARMKYEQDLKRYNDQQAYTQQQQQAQMQQQQQQYFDGLVQNANAWEARLATQDPDYNAQIYSDGTTKAQEVVFETQRLIQARGLPNSYEAQNALMQEAYDRVNLKINSLRGGQPLRGSPRPTSKASANAPAMQLGAVSTLDIVKRAMGVA